MPLGLCNFSWLLSFLLRASNLTFDNQVWSCHLYYPIIVGSYHIFPYLVICSCFIFCHACSYSNWGSSDSNYLSLQIQRLLLLSTGGTDTHLILVNFSPQKLTGSKMQHILELISITCNKNTCPGDKSALSPSGVRLGSPALSSRGFNCEDFKTVAKFIHEG